MGLIRQLSAVAALVFCLAHESHAECISDKAAFFYINGIWTNDTDAELGRVAIQDELNRVLTSFDRPRCGIVVTLAQNTGVNKIADLYESARQAGFTSNLQAQIFLDLLSHFVAGSTEASLTSFLTTRAESEILDIRFGSPSQEETDVSNHLTLYEGALEAGKRVIIISHSQGNWFANEGYDRLVRDMGNSVASRVGIVAVASPASVVEPGVAMPSPHTTLKEDFIWLVPGSLPYNAVAIPEGACGLPWDCHAFAKTYLVSPFPRARIDLEVKRLLAVHAEDDAFALMQDQIFSVSSPGLLQNDEVIGGDQITQVEFLAPLPTVVTNAGAGAFVADMRSDPTFRGRLSFQYVVHSGLGDSNIGTVVLNVAPGADRPPVAHFSLSAGTQSKSEGQTLTVTADPVTSEARVTFADKSTDVDGSITGWRWTTDTGFLLSEGLSTFTWGFRPGIYIVKLEVQDNGGATASAMATVEVLPPTTPGGWRMAGHDAEHSAASEVSGPQTLNTPTIRFETQATGSAYMGGAVVDAGGDVFVPTSSGLVGIDQSGVMLPGWPFRSNLSFSTNCPAIAADGTVYAISADVGSGTDLYAVTPSGNPKWSVPVHLGSSPSNPTVAADGTVYVVGDFQLFAIAPDGTLKWQRSSFDPGATPTVGSDGTLFASGGSTYQQTGGITAFNPDGSVRWNSNLGGSPGDPVSFGTMAIDSNGVVFVGQRRPSTGFQTQLLGIDASNGSILHQAASTCFIGTIRPTLAVAPSGNIVCGTFDGGVSIFSSDLNTSSTTYVGTSVAPVLAIGADGKIYVTNDAPNSAVSILPPSGGILSQFSTTAGTLPFVSIGQDGTLFVAAGYSAGGYKLYAFSTASQPTPSISAVNPSQPSAAPIDQRLAVAGLNFQCTDPSAATKCLRVEVSANGTVVGTLSVPGQIQNVTATTFTMFATFAVPGTNSLVAVNPDGGRSAPLTIEAVPPLTAPVAIFDGSQNSNFLQHQFGHMVGASAVRMRRRLMPPR